ncbi:hypothetical protein HO133_006901 [Letharia lupina]|uniref:Uncharacterized protein n=1 Tax=Letharia lupina TaxID=560253 RepID=A0A8H6F6W4_9LECA|nr:uncharacterized protein HO133_006901 [Letharia lupina]KAF6217431.1 hypothetical protein HO133_006901 [Letharia lupina]
MPYMQYPVIKSYYDKLKKGSIEADVDSLWINILGLFFTVPRNYGLEQETRPLTGIKKRADISIRYIRNGMLKKVILIEDKRVEFESQSSKWAEAVEQATFYLALVRKEQKNEKTLYAIATVGHYSRFYFMEPEDEKLRDYPGTDGRYYEFKDDEAEIEALLNELVAKTS